MPMRFGFYVCCGEEQYCWCFILTLAVSSLRGENCVSRGQTAFVVIGWHRMTSLTVIRVKFLEKTLRFRSTFASSSKKGLSFVCSQMEMAAVLTSLRAAAGASRAQSP